MCYLPERKEGSNECAGNDDRVMLLVVGQQP